MTSERVLRFVVPTHEALQQLIADSLPGDFAGEPVQVDFFRDIYFDTPTGDLERRGATVRLCVRKDGARTLSVHVHDHDVDGDQALRDQAEAVVEGTDAQDIFAGPSEPAKLVRALVDPARLEVQLELETLRHSWTAWRESDPATRMSVAADTVTLRLGETTAELHELEIRLPAGSAADLGPLRRALEEEYGMRGVLAGRLARAREMLDSLELRDLEQEIHSARVVAVIAQREGEIALVEHDGSLRIPTGPGFGEESCRQVLREHFGRAQGQLRLLSTRPGLGTRPAIEVWLAQRIELEEDAAPLVWLPVESVIAEVGTPMIRDTSTLTALNVAVRAGVPAEPAAIWSAKAGRKGEHPLHWRRGEGAQPPEKSAAGTEAGGGAKEAIVPPEAMFNMELSELAFNARVLALAEDPRTPLLERVRFLSILGSNLDEFFMTRVAGFHQQVASGNRKRTLDGLDPEQQLEAIGVRARVLLNRAYRFLWETLVPELGTEGIHILSWAELQDGDRAYLHDNYASQLGAVLTPLAADPSHPFPHIRNLRPALAVTLRVPESDSDQFAAIELPGDLPRLLPLPGGLSFVPLEEVIAASLPELYGGLQVRSAYTFRVTRSANFTIDEQAVSDMLLAVEEEVQKRPLGPVVRLEVQEAMPAEMREMLLRELQFEHRNRVTTLSEEDVYPVDRLVDLFGLGDIAALPLEHLHYPPMERSSPLDPERPIWEQLREREVLVRFPFDSFEQTVERLLAEAADDPDVLSVKITLYRTNRSSKIVELLRRARRKGKEVAALVELKASFDERRNIEWARALESSGIHVVFGPAHLKVHAKIAFVVRREGDGVRRYIHIGTGNLNAATAAGYTDLALLSSDPDLGAELSEVYNGLTGYSIRTEYEHLLVAPFNMRNRFLELIDREAEHARAGRGGSIRVKLNGLTDPEIIAALYRASQAGARLELVVRGICSLRPGVEGLSENIRVISILGRFLEHSRIYRFENAGEPEYFIGSADWRPRNLSKRVEVVTPIRDPAHLPMLDEILESCLRNPDAWELEPDGTYVQRP